MSDNEKKNLVNSLSDAVREVRVEHQSKNKNKLIDQNKR